MLATFVIGLREGLEAALIVGIIAAFLKRNGHSLRSMWVGVVAAIALSIGVGVVLEVISVGLPQAEQEGMESIIGAVAVVMVTAMIVWMSTHARTMRRELESTATDALKQGSVLALAVMAFLAVLREGFETSVFLLAAFQSSVSPLAAGAGAVIGLVVAAAIGYAIYRGGVKLNLGRFFTVTGVFLVFVAAGLVMSALRTAHEAGWILVGQDPTVDLSWLAPNGSVQAALITGVLGIPADPRVIEVVGWALYLVPVLLFVIWPARLRPGQRAHRLQFGLAAAALVAAVALVVVVPSPTLSDALNGSGSVTGSGSVNGSDSANGPSAITSADGRQLGTTELVAGSDSGSALSLVTTVMTETTTLALDDSAAADDTHLGLDARAYSFTSESTPAGLPTSVSLTDVDTANGGRTPVGVNRAVNPGPFDAAWKVSASDSVWVVGDTLLDASHQTTTTLTISGGGLSSPRTITVTAGNTVAASLSWVVDADRAAAVAEAYSTWQAESSEAALFTTLLPLALGVAALVLALTAVRGLRRARRAGRETVVRDASPDVRASKAVLPEAVLTRSAP